MGRRTPPLLIYKEDRPLPGLVYEPSCITKKYVFVIKNGSCFRSDPGCFAIGSRVTPL
jgi:hypothetical protein